MSKKVIAYCRVSTNGQVGEDKFGLDVQKEMIEDYCHKNDYDIIEWLVDEGESGVKESRPALDTILYGDIKNPPVEAVICAKSDRLARDIKLYFYYKQLLFQKNMELISTIENFGEMGAFAPILEAFTMFVAEQERRNITIRTSHGRNVKASRGGYSGGRAPYGYYIKHGKLWVDEKEAEIVKLVFKLREQENMSYPKIADYLNEHGYPTRNGKPFQFSTVKSILTNRPTYEGMYKYGDNEWVKGEHKRIL